jgi:FMN-dependent NADH-azoreductase
MRYYLITVPMWNFGIPYALKYYIDAIVQPGYLFRYNERGIPEGLVKGKKMICYFARRRLFSQYSHEHSDFVEPYLRAIFNFWDTDITFINAQPMDVTLDIRKAAMQNRLLMRTMVKSGECSALISIPVEACQLLLPNKASKVYFAGCEPAFFRNQQKSFC